MYYAGMRIIVPRRILAGALLLAILTGGSALAAGAYFSGIPDLPVMPGLTEDVASGVVFDKPEGRIVGMVATGGIARARVLDYYRGALPQLGWRPAGDSRFRRDGEILRLEFSGDAGGLTVRFRISPEPDSGQ